MSSGNWYTNPLSAWGAAEKETRKAWVEVMAAAECVITLSPPLRPQHDTAVSPKKSG